MEWLYASDSLAVGDKQQSPWQHVIILSVIVLAVTIIYANVTRAYFCSYDDFDNLHQTVFEDKDQPTRILTTSHFNSYKYRPVHRLANLFTNILGDGDPIVFRIRNLSFHLLNAILIYVLGWQLFRSALVSGAGALLFGLHPLANQSIIGAIWTNTLAHAGFLLALVMFMTSLRAKRFWSLWLIAALMSASLSLFTYDSAIVVFGLMFVCFLLFVVWRGEAIRMRYVVLFMSVSSILLGLYFVLRKVFVPNGWDKVTAVLPSPAIMVKNVVMYLTALLNPVDLVLANELFDTPLPSEITLNDSNLVVVVISGVFIASGVAIYVMHRLRDASVGSQKFDWAAALFLFFGIGAPLLPVLIFSSRPSETYLYLPVAFYVLLLVYLLSKVLHHPGKPNYGFYLSIVFLVVVFSAATWIRNQRVSECGQTVYRILHNLPENLLRNGSWLVAFANVPGEKSTRRYGFYGFRGIDTIGDGLAADPATTHALQLVFRNKLLSGKVVKPEELPSMCSQNSASAHKLCVFVHDEGKIETCCLNSAFKGRETATLFRYPLQQFIN